MAEIERTCVTRLLKVKRALDEGVKPTLPTKHSGSPLFNGTVHVLRVTFQTPTGGVGVGVSDTAMARSYLAVIASTVADYCSAYGPCSLTVDTDVYPIPFTTGATYTDAQLQGLVNLVAQAHGWGPNDCVVVLNPPTGVENTDAPVSQGVLGYHGYANLPYLFVNVLGSGLTIGDAADVYAVALSHELEEMTVDPKADLSNPEVGDPCAGNCGIQYRDFFSTGGAYLGGGPNFPPSFSYAWFIQSVVAPSTAGDCPSPEGDCAYAPPGVGSSPPPPPPPGPSWWQALVAWLEGIWAMLTGAPSKKSRR